MTRIAPPSLKRSALVVFALLLVLGLAGCSLLDSGPDYLTLTESSGMFHIEVPSNWAGKSQNGLIAATDAEELPSDVEAIDTFWLLVYPSMEATDLPLADYLPQLLEARAQEREWQAADYGTVEDAEIGGRAAVMMPASGVDAGGTPFEGEYYLVRSSDRDIIIAAIAPQGLLADYATDINEILTERWYWHQPDSSAD